MVPLSAMLTGVIALLLMRQPNLGETMIFVAAWIVLLDAVGRADADPLRARRRRRRRCSSLAYLFYDVATQRIDGFLFARGRPISGRIGACGR